VSFPRRSKNTPPGWGRAHAYGRAQRYRDQQWREHFGAYAWASRRAANRLERLQSRRATRCAAVTLIVAATVLICVWTVLLTLPAKPGDGRLPCRSWHASSGCR